MIRSYEYSGEGMHRVYENEKWTVGIKNYKPANALDGLDMLERHNETDELFVLLEGHCILLSAIEGKNGWEFEITEMEYGKVYKIPQSLWHNTITEKYTKMVLIEDVSTGEANSDFYTLTEDDKAKIKKLARGKSQS